MNNTMIRSFLRTITLTLILTASLIASAQDMPGKKYITVIDRLAGKKNVQEAFRYIIDIEPLTLRDHIMLTEIPAPLNLEHERAVKFAGMLEEAGADSVWIDNAGNVIALRKGTKRDRVVAINAHMDTVFPEGTDVTVRISGDTLFAPGIGDDTRGLIILLTLLRSLEASGIETPSDLLFVGTVGEEGLGDLKGSRYLFHESGIKIDSWISVDGGDISGIVNSALGSVRYRINFEGPGGHSWGAFGIVNPIHALSDAIDNFVVEADKFTGSGPRTSYNVGKIGGGTSINSVPYSAWAEVDMRSESPEMLTGIESILLAAAENALANQNELRRRGPELELTVTPVGRRPSGTIDPSEPLVQRAMASSIFFGKNPELNIGSTDASIPISMGIPAITIGRGGKGGANHSLDEWWINADGYIAIQNALLIVLSEAGID